MFPLSVSYPDFVLGCFGAHAAAQTQQSVSRVSLDVRDAAIVNVFQTVQQQTGCSFVYNTSDIDTDRKVTVSAQDEPLTALLDKLFAGSDIAYTLRDKHIVLSKKLKIPPPTTLRAESAEPLRTLRACR